MRFHSLAGCAVLASLSTATLAAPLALYPVQTGAEIARFRQGVPTLDLETPTGAVQITPLPFDHGHVTFGLAIYNKAGLPANFGIDNVSARIGEQDVPVLGVDELEKRAKSRAMWTQIGIAALTTGLAAAASTAYTTQHSYGHMRTPFGGYSWQTAYRDNSAGVVGATAATAGGIAAIVGVQNRLDYTLANLARGVVQTTTLDPDSSYGGRIVLEKPKGDIQAPYDVHVVIGWNGVRYPFVFRVTRQGEAMPPAYTIAPRPAVATAPAPVLQPLVLPAPPAPAPMRATSRQPDIVPVAAEPPAMTIAASEAAPEPIGEAAPAAAAPSQAAMERAAYLRGRAEGLAQLAAMGGGQQ